MEHCDVLSLEFDAEMLKYINWLSSWPREEGWFLDSGVVTNLLKIAKSTTPKQFNKILNKVFKLDWSKEFINCYIRVIGQEIEHGFRTIHSSCKNDKVNTTLTKSLYLAEDVFETANYSYKKYSYDYNHVLYLTSNNQYIGITKFNTIMEITAVGELNEKAYNKVIEKYNYLLK